MTDWDLVIFDNDGVLVDSEVLATQVEIDLLAEYGYEITFEECIDRFLGGTIEATRASVEADTGQPLPADFEDRYHDGLFAAFRTSLQPVPGVREVLAGLDVPYCVASSGTHERIRFALTKVGLLDRFPDDRIFSAEDVERGKPAPDLFLHVAERLGQDPAGCLVIEDSPAGVAAARAAGMTVVGYAAMTPVGRLQAADEVVKTMAEIVPIIEGSDGIRPRLGA